MGDQGHDEAIQQTYESVAATDLPDHWKSGYTAADFEMRRQEFVKTLSDVIGTDAAPKRDTGVLNLLDVGCGNGAYTAAAVAPGRAVFGVDTSKALIKEALARCPALRGCVASCYALPFPDAAFDIVYSLGLLQALSDRARCLEELVRVVRPGGVGLVEFLPKWNLADAGARAAFHLAKLDWRATCADFEMLKATSRAWRGITIFRTSPQEVRRILLRAGAERAWIVSKRFLVFNSHYRTVVFRR